MSLRALKEWILLDYTDRYWNYRENYLRSKTGISRLYYYIKLKRIGAKHNADLGVSYHDPSAEIVSKPYMPHGLSGVIISRKAKIGNNCTILHQVTIGTRMTAAKSDRKEDAIAPIIGNNVFIGAGAKIIGDIHIGDNVLIGANAVVTKDVPSDYTVVGNPMRMFKTKNEYHKG